MLLQVKIIESAAPRCKSGWIIIEKCEYFPADSDQRQQQAELRNELEKGAVMMYLDTP